MIKNPVFWNYFLAAELPGYKVEVLMSELDQIDTDPITFLLSHPILSPAETQRIKRADLRALEQSLLQGATLLLKDSYPETMAEVSHAPPALFTWGQSECLYQPCIGIVGTRHASSYGKACAQKFAEHFAEYGITVVSGGALGIDAAAHAGTIKAGGSTVAVLFQGIESVYPSQHRGLFNDIKKAGCLVSSFACGSKSHMGRPIMRNFVVAALCHAIIVIEAPEKSGALSTAQYAAELGKEVFVVPGQINHNLFRGSHALIRDGANLVDHPDQVLEFIGIDPMDKKAKDTPAFSPLQEIILSHLEGQTLLPEVIVAKTGLDTQTVLSELTMLELEGVVLRENGMFTVCP